MKKLLIIPTLLIALSTSGCATPFGTRLVETLAAGATLVTVGVANPITTQQIYNLEAAYGVALAGAVAYRERPRCTKTALESISNFCARRSIVVKLQAADRKAQFALNRLKIFVADNPTLDASDLFNIATEAVSTFTQLKENVL